MLQGITCVLEAGWIICRYMSELPNSHELDKQILVETVGSVLWFVMDGLWMLNQPLYAKAMVVPTLAVNLFVFRYTNRSFSQISVVAAMNSWLLMNVFWMVGDLDKDPRLIEFARATFALGMVLLALAVGRAAADPERLMKVLARFRRLRA
jgi:hypothetical protein